MVPLYYQQIDIQIYENSCMNGGTSYLTRSTPLVEEWRSKHLPALVCYPMALVVPSFIYHLSNKSKTNLVLLVYVRGGYRFLVKFLLILLSSVFAVGLTSKRSLEGIVRV